MELLEERRLLSVTPSLEDETATFSGSDGAESLYLRMAPDGVLEFSETGGDGTYLQDLDPLTAEDQTLTITGSTLITVELAGGNDTLVIQSSDLVGIEFEGGDGDDTIDYSSAGVPLRFKFSPTTVTVLGDDDATDRLIAADIEKIIGGAVGDTVDLSENQDHLVFVVRQTGNVTITGGDYTINADGTVAVSARIRQPGLPASAISTTSPVAQAAIPSSGARATTS